MAHRSAAGRPIVPLRALVSHNFALSDFANVKATPNPNISQPPSTLLGKPGLTHDKKTHTHLHTTPSHAPRQPSTKLDPPRPEPESVDPIVAERERRAKHARLSMAREPPPSSRTRRESVHDADKALSHPFSPPRNSSNSSSAGHSSTHSHGHGVTGVMTSPLPGAFSLDAASPRMYPTNNPHPLSSPINHHNVTERRKVARKILVRADTPPDMATFRLIR